MNPTSDTDIRARRDSLLARMESAAREAGRRPEEVRLTAVSKVQPDERIRAALAAGQRVFGENRVQEARARWAPYRSTTDGLELRLIGPLQTNKVREAVSLFDVIETVDRPALAEALAAERTRTGRLPRLYVQINTGEEPQKSGVAPAEADAFIRLLRDSLGLSVEGLMCIPPADEPAGLHFALLAKIARRHALGELSMGMSGDFETAIRFGATSVRIGEAFFGERTTGAQRAR
jgi:hypothetical protein